MHNTDSKGERLFWGGGPYKDRSFCSAADTCAVKDCMRRLTDEDKRLIKEGNFPVAMIEKCDKYEDKQ